jgi:hypothetical protein
MILNATELRELLTYDAIAGTFLYNSRSTPQFNAQFAGEIAGWINPRGYRIISIKNRGYGASKLAWLYMTGEWPTKLIDHINGCRADDRFCNLRLVTPAQNCSNGKVYTSNKTGYRGIFWKASRNKWSVTIGVNRRCIFVGEFIDKDEAIKARLAAEARYHGVYSRTKHS